jgi:hypothetical protein
MFEIRSWVVLAGIVLALFGRQWPWLFAQRRCPQCGPWLPVSNCHRGWTRVGEDEDYRGGLIDFYTCQGCGRSFVRSDHAGRLYGSRSTEGQFTGYSGL